MSADASYFLGAITIGLGATFFMDLWSLFLNRAFRIASPNFCFVGRWFCHMTEGKFVHTSIGAAPQRPAECAVGWIAHYVIGAAYALALVVLVSGDWLAQPTLLPALFFGVVTVVVPFFIMQPAFGLGIASSKTPDPRQARLKSLLSHVVFGIGLYLSALGVSFLMRVLA